MTARWPLMLDGEALVLAQAERLHSRRRYGDGDLSDYTDMARMVNPLRSRLGDWNAEARLARLSSDGRRP